jgi:hypothetical protein
LRKNIDELPRACLGGESGCGAFTPGDCLNMRFLHLPMALAAGIWCLNAANAATAVFAQSVGDIASPTTASAAGSMFPAITARYGIVNDGDRTFVPSANFAVTGIPEPPAWAMMALGFVGLGYAAFRRSGKSRRPVTGSL